MNFSVGNSASDAVLSVVRALGDSTAVTQNADLKQKFELVETTLELKAVLDTISALSDAAAQPQTSLYSAASVSGQDPRMQLGQSPAGAVPQQDPQLIEMLLIAEMLHLLNAADDSNSAQPQFPTFQSSTSADKADPLAGWGQSASSSSTGAAPTSSGGSTISGSQNTQTGTTNAIVGNNNSQDGEQNATIGSNNDVFGTGNTTVGLKNGVDGESNLTIGSGNTVMKGDNNLSLGDNLDVKGSDNIVIGDNVSAKGDNIKVFIAEGSTTADVTATSGQTVFANSSGDIIKINADDSWAKYNAAGKRLEGGKAGTAEAAGLHQQAGQAAVSAYATQQFGSTASQA